MTHPRTRLALALWLGLLSQPLPVYAVHAHNVGIISTPPHVTLKGWTPPKPQVLAFLYPVGGGFAGGNQSTTDVYTLCRLMARSTTNMAAPNAGGTLTVNSVALGSYDYVVKQGNQTISSFSNADWFTATADSRSAFIVVRGDLTINAGQTFTPTNRKLFTVVYVTGNLTVNGAMSMTARGANHSATGSNVTAGNILLISGTHGGQTNPTIQSNGQSGGAAVNNPSVAQNGSNGSSAGAGTPFTTGGGAAGGTYQATSGAGATGTCFSGGPGGGGAAFGGVVAQAGQPNGGHGGDNNAGGGSSGCDAGSGNPGGSGSGPHGANGANGTGGVLIYFCEGTLSGTGSMTANGVAAAPGDGNEDCSGGGSGGGIVVGFAAVGTPQMGTITRGAVGSLDFGTTKTWAHTTAASDNLMLAFVRDDGTGMSGVSNSNGAMTAFSPTPLSIGGFGYYAYYYKNPTAAFAHTLTATTSSANVGAASVSYGGVDLASFPLGLTTTTGTGNTSATLTLRAGSWCSFFSADRFGANPTANTNVAAIVTPGGGSSMTLFCSNAAQPAGSFTQISNDTGTSGAWMIEIPTAVVVPASATGGAFCTAQLAHGGTAGNGTAAGYLL